MKHNKRSQQENYSPYSSNGSQGIEAVLERALHSYEKLPMLQVVFERLKMLLNTALRNFSSGSVIVEISSFKSVRFSKAIKNFSEKDSIVVARAVEWNNFILLCLDNELVSTFIDILLGGGANKTQIASKTQHTSIEQAIMKQLSEVILDELSSAFKVIGFISFVVERLETNPNFVNIARAGDAVMILDMEVTLDQKLCNISFIIPYATLDPIKKLLQQVFIGERSDHGSQWTEDLMNSVNSVPFLLEAIIEDKKDIPLEKLAKMKVGDTIITSCSADSDVTLKCGNKALFKGKIGKSQDNVAMSITKVLGK